MKQKLTSRKFWLAIAAALYSISTSIAGYQIDNYYITIAGLICGTASIAIYTFCEAYIDGKAVTHKQETTNLSGRIEPDNTQQKED